MTVLHIACDNCGAKYKLPETFSGSQAKCQKCGSVIDVARQRAAAAGAPAAAAQAAPPKPAAAAKPAVDRSKEAPKPAAAAPRTERAGSRRGKDDAGHAEGRRGRPEREKKKSSAMPLLLSGVGLVAIVVVAVLMLGGGDKPKTDATASAGAANAATPPAAAPAAAQPATAPAPDAPKVEAPKVETPPAEAPKPAAAPAEAPKPAEAAPVVPDDPTRVKRPWEKLRNPPATMEEVSDPKSYGDVTWPPSLDDAKKAEIRELCADAAGDGIRSVRAKQKLEQTGWSAMFGIVEQLQKLDYKSAEQSMIAFDLNKLLDRITAGLNARFEPVEASETLVPAKAEWNTRTVREWINLMARLQDEAQFNKDRAERVKKQAADK